MLTRRNLIRGVGALLASTALARMVPLTQAVKTVALPEESALPVGIVFENTGSDLIRFLAPEGRLLAWCAPGEIAAFSPRQGCWEHVKGPALESAEKA